MVSDGGDGFGFALDSDSFFGFDSLMESLAKSTTWHRTTCVGVDDHDLSVHYDVFLVETVDCLCFDGVFYVVDLIEPEISVEIFYSENAFELGDTFGSEGGVFVLFVDVVVSMWFGVCVFFVIV